MGAPCFETLRMKIYFALVLELVIIWIHSGTTLLEDVSSCRLQVSVGTSTTTPFHLPQWHRKKRIDELLVNSGKTRRNNENGTALRAEMDSRGGAYPQTRLISDKIT